MIGSINDFPSEVFLFFEAKEIQEIISGVSSIVGKIVDKREKKIQVIDVKTKIERKKNSTNIIIEELGISIALKIFETLNHPNTKEVYKFDILEKKQVRVNVYNKAKISEHDNIIFRIESIKIVLNPGEIEKKRNKKTTIYSNYPVK